MRKVVAGAKRWRVTGGTRRRFFTNHLSLFLTGHLFFLTACGFQPLHSQEYQRSLDVNLSAVAVEAKGTTSSDRGLSSSPTSRRYSELLVAEIRDQSNPLATRAETQFKLAITFNEGQQGLFVKPDGTASRGDLVYSSQYTITRLKDMKVIATGGINRVSSFNTSDTADYASYVSIEDARKRGILELAQDYKMRLATLLPTLNDPNAEEVKPKEEKKDDADFPTPEPSNPNETYRPGY